MLLTNAQMINTAFTFLAVFTIFGCTTTDTIRPAIDSDSKFEKAVYKGKKTIVSDKGLSGAYRVFNQGSTGFTSIETVRLSTESRANRFCERKNKVVEVIEETTSIPPHILGNWPRVEIVFKCVFANRYDELSKLKKLLDEGVITQSEYKHEKQRILDD